MDKITIKFDADLTALSPDELVALNQLMGKHVDTIREYRRTINAALSEKQAKANAYAKLTPDELKALGVSVVVPVEPLIAELGQGE